MPRASIKNCDIYYSHNGVEPSDDKPSLVLVHGAGGQEQDWPVTWRGAKNATRFMGLTQKSHGRQLDRFPVYALDLPGHGKSGGDSRETVDAYADAVAAFLDALDLQRVLLVGHSMGAAIALSLAVRHNPSLAGIALIGGSSRMVVSDAILEGLKTDFEATIDAIVKYSWHRNTGTFFKQKARQRMLDAGPAVVYDDFLACSRFDLTDRLADITVPVLVIASDSDRMVPMDKSREMADALPHSVFVSFENCGHFLHVEETGQVAHALVSFLAAPLMATGAAHDSRAPLS